MTDDDAVASLRSAKQCLANGGPIVVTVPSDSRPVHEQHEGATESDQYHNGISAWHVNPVTKPRLLSWIDRAGLKIQKIQEIDYTFFGGWGVVCK
jgi:hypothetical protein